MILLNSIKSFVLKFVLFNLVYATSEPDKIWPIGLNPIILLSDK